MKPYLFYNIFSSKKIPAPSFFEICSCSFGFCVLPLFYEIFPLYFRPVGPYFGFGDNDLNSLLRIRPPYRCPFRPGQPAL